MKLSQLIEALASETGSPAGAVRLKARLLREAGLISSGGRGRGGADMNANDVSIALLSEIVIGETTAVATEVERIGALELGLCEWVNISRLERQLDGSDNRLPRSAYKYQGPKPPQLAGLDNPVFLANALPRLLSMAATQKSTVEIEHLQLNSDAAGVTVQIKYQAKMSPKTAENAYVRESGDPSDALLFPSNQPEIPETWHFVLRFRQEAMQRSRKDQMLRLPGEIVMRIAREALKQ